MTTDDLTIEQLKSVYEKADAALKVLDPILKLRNALDVLGWCSPRQFYDVLQLREYAAEALSVSRSRLVELGEFQDCNSCRWYLEKECVRNMTPDRCC